MMLNHEDPVDHNASFVIEIVNKIKIIMNEIEDKENIKN